MSDPESSFFLAFPNGQVDINLEDYPDDMDQAREIMRILLEGEPWVQLHARHAPGNYTQWTVMKRDERGVPLQIMCQEFDGNFELINNEPGDTG